MQQYSVLLVEDEEDVIRVIMKKIDWERMGFTVIGYAHNGVEALEMVEECVPDVVLTDIKMPYMDGLAMSRKLKERYQNIKEKPQKEKRQKNIHIHLKVGIKK